MVEVVIRSQYEEAKSRYTKLNPPEKEKDFWVINGVIDVIDDNGYPWDFYGVKIIFTSGYPTDLPLLVETSGKIERNEEWHINKGGDCCLGTEAKLFREMSDGVTLTRWLDRHVVPYLANHILRLKEQRYACGEFSHGARGITEYYQDIFDLKTARDVITRIRAILGIGPYGLNAPCFCGSGKKYKRCCLLNKRDYFYKIPVHVLRRDLIFLESLQLNS